MKIRQGTVNSIEFRHYEDAEGELQPFTCLRLDDESILYKIENKIVVNEGDHIALAGKLNSGEYEVIGYHNLATGEHDFRDYLGSLMLGLFVIAMGSVYLINFLIVNNSLLSMSRWNIEVIGGFVSGMVILTAGMLLITKSKKMHDTRRYLEKLPRSAL